MLKQTIVGSLLFSQMLIAGIAAENAPVNAQETRPHMDLAFCIDTTGSMQNELDVVKSKTKELVAKLSSGKPAPIIRVGMVAFRDRGDEYVTKVFPFTDDIDKIVKDISDLQAGGGGDGPEAVNQAIHSALHDLKWTEDKKTARLVFLIGDAAPHEYPGDFKWQTECKQAIARGIQINTIGCEGLEGYPTAQGTEVFKGIAKLTDGRYETLAYKQEVATADGRRETVISSAGVRYKVKPSAGKDAWKAGAATLSAKGMAEEVKMAPAAVGRPASGYAAADMAFSFSSARARGGSAGAYAPVSRSESNLADVLLKGAKEAAKKSLGH